MVIEIASADIVSARKERKSHIGQPLICKDYPSLSGQHESSIITIATATATTPPPRSSLPPWPSIPPVSSLSVSGDSIWSSLLHPSIALSPPHDDAAQRWQAGRMEEEFHGSGKVNRNLRLARLARSGRSRWPSPVRETGVPNRPRRFKWQQGRKASVIQWPRCGPEDGGVHAPRRAAMDVLQVPQSKGSREVGQRGWISQ
jgi:hypothetical protein